MKDYSSVSKYTINRFHVDYEQPLDSWIKFYLPYCSHMCKELVQFVGFCTHLLMIGRLKKNQDNPTITLLTFICFLERACSIVCIYTTAKWSLNLSLIESVNII